MKAAKQSLVKLQEEARDNSRQVENINKAISEIQKTAQKVERNIGQAADIIYKDFCQKIGYSNIREYEKTQLVEQKEFAEIRLQFATSISKFENQ